MSLFLLLFLYHITFCLFRSHLHIFCFFIILFYLFFFFYLFGDHRYLHVLTHSFPTRRSSDLLPRCLPATGMFPGFRPRRPGHRPTCPTCPDRWIYCRLDARSKAVHRATRHSNAPPWSTSPRGEPPHARSRPNGAPRRTHPAIRYASRAGNRYLSGRRQAAPTPRLAANAAGEPP